jgi:hypothetical protein
LNERYGILAQHTYSPRNTTPISNQWPGSPLHWLPEANEWRCKMGISTYHIENAVKGAITSTHKNRKRPADAADPDHLFSMSGCFQEPIS